MSKRKFLTPAQKIEHLEAKLQLKNNVMAVLLQEHIEQKKNLGSPKATLDSP